MLVYWQSPRWEDLRSAEINECLKDAAGEEFSAKDFCTWNATVLAAVALGAHDGRPRYRRAKEGGDRGRQAGGGYLSNTPAVCRRSYIDPRAFDRFDSGETIYRALGRIVNGSDPSEFRIVSGSSARCSGFSANRFPAEPYGAAEIASTKSPTCSSEMLVARSPWLTIPTRSCPSITGRRRTFSSFIVWSASSTESSAPIVTGLP